MRRGNGLIRAFLGMMLALILVLGVCGGVVAEGQPKSTTKDNTNRIWQIERDVFKLDTKIDNIYDMQMLKLENTNENIRNIKEWVTSEKDSAEKWYSTLSLLTTFVGTWITIFGIIVSAYAAYNTKKQKENYIKNILDLENEYNSFVEQLSTSYKNEQDKLSKSVENKYLNIKNSLENIYADHVKDLCSKKEILDISIEKTLRTSDHILTKYNQPQIEEENKTSIDTTENIINEILSHQQKGLFDTAIMLCGILAKNPHNIAEAYFYLGNIFYKKSENINDYQIELDLLSESHNYFELSLHENPNQPSALTNLGSVLLRKAQISPKENRTQILNEAERELKKALEFGNKNWVAASVLGMVLLTLATEGEVNEHFLSEAENASLKAEEFKKGTGAYVLACIAALKKDSNQCKKMLQLSRKKGYTFQTITSIEINTCFDNVRNEQWFKDFLEELRQEEQEAKTKQAKSDEDDKDTEE